MADKVEFELVSPEKLLVSQPVDMVVVPGSEGNFGVLAGHSPFISTIRPGVIDIFEGERIVDRIFIAGGFAEVTETRCTVLAIVFHQGCGFDDLEDFGIRFGRVDLIPGEIVQRPVFVAHSTMPRFVALKR